MEKIKVFVSYSHQNEDWVSKDGKFRIIPWLQKQLEEAADIWTDHTLKRLIGEEYTKLITNRILDSDIVILLISQDFVSSQYIMEVELPLIRQQYKSGKIKIIPLLLTDLTRKGKEKIAWIFDLQTYPNDTKPLIDFANDAAEWSRIKVEILDGVENKIDELTHIRIEQERVIREEVQDVFENTEIEPGKDPVIHPKLPAEKSSDAKVKNSSPTVTEKVMPPEPKPRISIKTIFLWAIPVILVLFALLIIPGVVKHNSSDPVAADTYYNIGCSYALNGENGKAIKAFQKALSIKPDYAEAYLNMGNAYGDNDRCDKAITAYEKAISINPDYVDAYYNIGVVYNKTGDYEKALTAYQNAVSINPEYGAAYYNMGVTFNKMGEYDKAIAACQKAVSINPDDAAAYSIIGNAYCNKKDPEMQKEYYKKAAKLGHKECQDWLKTNNESW